MTKINRSLLKSQNYGKKDFFSLAIIFLFALLSLRGAFYGIASPDESFYLTIPYRLILGDALLVDEWHASQLSAFLLYLPMKIFMSITGSTDGIILFFRCLYVFCQTAVSVFTYTRIKKYGIIPALISSLMFLLYTPENVQILDYYTMSLMGMQVCALLFFTSENFSKAKLIFIGIVFACTVTAQPFNCIIYFLYSLIVLFCYIRRNKKVLSEYTKKLLSIKNWIFITIGIFLTAIVFLAFILSQASFSEIFNNIGNIFGGHDHTLPFSSEGETDMFSYFTIIETLFGFTPVSFCISLICVLFVAFDKKRETHKKQWLFISLCILSVYFIATLITSFTTPTEILFRPYPLFLLTFILIILRKNRNGELLGIWLTGVLYIVFLGIISQALNYVGVIGCVISNTALVPAAKELFEELKSETSEKEKPSRLFLSKKVLSVFLCAVTIIACSVNIITGSILKLTDDALAPGFGRGELFSDTVTATSGPLKGIKMSQSQFRQYVSLLNDFNTIKSNTDGKVLIAGLIPWSYFCFDTAFPTFTTWYIKEEFDLYEPYYEDEEHRPSCVYVPEISFFWNNDIKITASTHFRFFKNMFSGESEQGETGKILYVNKMR